MTTEEKDNNAVEAVEDAAEAVVEALTDELNETVEAVNTAAGHIAEASLPGADDEHSIAGAAANLFGISRPQDEYGTRGTDRDGMSDAELMAMGVEPDGGPSTTLIWTFVALVAVLIVVGVALGSMFQVTALSESTAKASVAHPMLVETRAAGLEAIGAYGAVEHPATDDTPAGPTGYRVPIDVGMQMLLDDPSLLAAHPLRPEPEAAPVPTPAPTAVPNEGSGGTAPADGENGLPAVQEVVPSDGQPAAIDPHAGHNH